MHSFCGYKQPFFFSDHSSGKTFSTKWRCPDRQFATFFQKKSPDLWGMKKKLNVQNKKKVREEKNLLCTFRNSFLFWTNKKKVRLYERNFLLFLPIKCWSNIFWLLWGFIRWCVNVFFVCSKQERIPKSASEVFFFTNFCLVLKIHFFFMPQGRRISSEKQLQIDDRDIVILSKSFSRRMIWKKKCFFISAKLMQPFSFFIYCAKSQKKSPFWKKLVFPSIPLFSITAFKWDNYNFCFSKIRN